MSSTSDIRPVTNWNPDAEDLVRISPSSTSVASALGELEDSAGRVVLNLRQMSDHRHPGGVAPRDLGPLRLIS